MNRELFAAIIAFYGLAHLMGFANTFGVTEMSHQTQQISKAQRVPEVKI